MQFPSDRRIGPLDLDLGPGVHLLHGSNGSGFRRTCRSPTAARERLADCLAEWRTDRVLLTSHRPLALDSEIRWA